MLTKKAGQVVLITIITIGQTYFCFKFVHFLHFLYQCAQFYLNNQMYKLIIHKYSRRIFDMYKYTIFREHKMPGLNQLSVISSYLQGFSFCIICTNCSYLLYVIDIKDEAATHRRIFLCI